MAEETLKQKTAKGLFWGFINNGTQQLLNLFFGIFLARLLTPADYFSASRFSAGKWLYLCFGQQEGNHPRRLQCRILVFNHGQFLLVLDIILLCPSDRRFL